MSSDKNVGQADSAIKKPQPPEQDCPGNLTASRRLRAVREKEALHVTGLKRSNFWAIQNPRAGCFQSTFPRRFKLGESSHAPTVWWLHELVSWLEARAAASISCRAEKRDGS